MTKITAFSALAPASVQPDDVLPIVDIHDTSMDATGTTRKIAVADLVPVDWVNACASAYGAAPGAADNAPAINAALADAAAGSRVCYLPAGVYKTSTPIAIPPFTTLLGSPASSRMAPHVSLTTGITGTVIQPAATFTSGTYPADAIAAILIADPTTGGYGIAANEQHVESILIDGSRMSAAHGGTDATGNAVNTAGICVYSATGSTGVGRTSLTDVMVLNMPNWGYINTPNAGGAMRAQNVNIRTCGTLSGTGGGFSIHASDSEWLYCAAYNCQAEGFLIYASYDSIWCQCHAEHSNAGNGCISYEGSYNSGTVDSGGITFEGCTTDGGTTNGIYLFSNSATATAPPVNITGGFFRRPGSTSTTSNYAGIAVDGYSGPVNISGTQVYPGLPDGAGSFSPQWGLACTSNNHGTNITVSGSVLNGASGGIFNDNTAATLTISGDTIFGQGQGGSNLTSPVLYAPGVTLQAVHGYGSASSQYLAPVQRILDTAPAGTLAVTHDRSAGITQELTPSNTGLLYCQTITLAAGITCSKLNFWVDTGAAGSGGTSGFAAILTVTASGTARIAAVSSAITAGDFPDDDAPATVTLASPYTPPVTGQYYAGISFYQGTPPHLLAADGPRTTAFSAAAPALCGTGGTFTSPPSVNTSIGTLTANINAGFYCWIT